MRAIVLGVGLPLLLATSACGESARGNGRPNDAPVNLSVFAAASLQAAFNKIGDQFHTAHSNVTVTFNFAGSDALATQINQGASADVFASANTTQMKVVVTAGGIDDTKVRTF